MLSGLIKPRRLALLAALTAGLFVFAPVAYAQSTGNGSPDDLEPPYWETIGGYEGDSHDVGYGFFGPQYNHPIKDNLAVTARIFGNYLHYEFPNSMGGITRVNGPGVSPGVGLRIGRRTRLKLSAGLSAKQRDREVTDRTGRIVEETDEWKVGLGLGGDLYWNLNRRTNVHALAHYGTEDDYLWSRVGIKRQVSNMGWKGKHTLYLGAEGITQGNDEIWSNQVGALAEVLFVPSRLSLMVRGGYKRTTFDVGDDKTGPYFGVGVYKRF